MKKTYFEPDMKITAFDAADVITTSGTISNTVSVDDIPADAQVNTLAFGEENGWVITF